LATSSVPRSAGGSGAPSAGGGLGSILSSMLDSNRDGSAFDDILDMATRGRR